MTIIAAAADRRLHPRFSALSPALVVGEGGMTSHCFVDDLSAGGARISGVMALRPGEMVRLLLQLPGRGPFSLVGHVVRSFPPTPHAPAAYGISFAHVPARATQSAAETVVALQHQSNLHEPVVLVVDTSAHTCFSLVQDLQRVGRKAIAVTTPLDAIEWLLDGASHFDTALVDIALNNADGCDLLTFLADEYPEVRRVLMSDPRRASQLERARQLAHPHAVLPKPWDVAALARVFT